MPNDLIAEAIAPFDGPAIIAELRRKDLAGESTQIAQGEDGLAAGGGERAGPRDNLDINTDGDLIPDFMQSREKRAQRTLDLLESGLYYQVIRENFYITDGAYFSQNPDRKDLIDRLNAGLWQLMDTKVGKRLAIHLSYKGWRQELELVGHGRYKNYGAARIGMKIRFNFHQAENLWYVPERPPYMQVYAAVIGHELGHRLLGYKDSVPSGYRFPDFNDFKSLPLHEQIELLPPDDRSDNVRYVENPIWIEFGNAPRSSYLNPSMYKKYYEALNYPPHGHP
ncbi:MAG: hypothetical protein ABJF50_21235 [Paracoccaceae bacterium]|uniref:hypothetical protein n=1 Tax=Hyphomonas sp. TaxID=87 RepID=UPI003273946A